MCEVIAMLSAGSPPLDSIRGSSNTGITSGDVACCLNRVDRMTYLYSLSKFALDDSGRSELNQLAIKEASIMGFRLTNKESKQTVSALALTALEASISPNRCRRCKGVGEITIESRVEACESCQGIGSKSITERSLATILKVTRFQARKVWKERLADLLSRYADRDEQINRAIFIGLK